ncbi:hypothetical protein V1506DRAFT_34889 [Lipomyces tetrasporus]
MVMTAQPVVQPKNLHSQIKQLSGRVQSNIRPQKIKRPAGCCNMKFADIQKISTYFQECASNNYARLSKADHLLTLVKFNVFRAMMTNFFTFGLTMECMQDEAVSPFSTMNPGRLDLPTAEPSPNYPAAHLPHHPWLDMFPYLR